MFVFSDCTTYLRGQLSNPNPMNLRALLIFVFCFIFIGPSLRAQTTGSLYLQSGTVRAEANLAAFVAGPVPTDVFGGYYYRILQFSTLPDVALRAKMETQGIILMDYLPERAFVAGIPVSFPRPQLSACGVTGVYAYGAAEKISRTIAGGFQDWAIRVPGTVDLTVQYHRNIPLNDILVAAAPYGRILSHHAASATVTLRVGDFTWRQLASEPWVYFVNAIAPPDLPDDTRGRSLHRSNTINNDYISGRRYDGTGINVAIADDGFVGPHIDFQGRMTNFATGAGQSHGDMCSGICVGAGNLNPTMRGMATGAYLYTYNINGYPQIVNAVANFNNYGIVISSTSYSQGCNEYTSDTQFGDNLLYNNAHLQAVFSGGNNQSANCNYGAGNGWGNITGGYKQGKNVIACGNLTALEVLDNTSSRGPASDGRIKPDICANGNSQNSTNENNTYQVGGGTSAASPGIAGIFAQLYHAYKQLNGTTLAPAPLLKACLLNSAEDIGNAGPDFTYGWGRVNALRALQTLELNRYLSDSVLNGGFKNHTITVPANTRQLRVMVYWSDVGGSPASTFSLVNNLNMTVTDPSSTVWNPWILNTAPTVAALTSPATRGIDSLNNVEQITLDNPVAGTYTVRVNGTLVPSLGQRYYLVWEFRTDAVAITYPNGGEGFVPGETEVIRWDGQRNLGTYDLAYSTNNGSTWTNIATGIAQTTQHYSWTVPTVTSGSVRLRITRGANSDVTDSSLAIIGVPSGLAVAWSCPDSVRLTWSAVSGAAGYTVYRLGTKYMNIVGNTTTTSMVITGVPSTGDEWFSVAAITTQGNRGRRSEAVRRVAGIFSCPLPIDVRLSAVISPTAGNQFACTNLNAVPVTVRVENTGQTSQSNIPLRYTLNGGAVVNAVLAGTLAPGAVQDFTFPGTINLSSGGIFTLRSWTALPGDLVASNDTLQVVTTVSPTAPLPFTQNFEGTTFPPAAWSVVNGGGAGTITWARRTAVVGPSGASNAAAFMDNYTYNSPATEDILNSQVFSLSGVNTALLTFDVAYARYSASYIDYLRIDVSNDCGQTWQASGYLKSDLALATAGTLTSSFTPTSSNQWRRDTVVLNNWIGPNVMVRFVNINGYGNNLYIDNVQVTGFNPSVSLNLTLLIEGFHDSGAAMRPVMYNCGVSGNTSVSDSVTVQLRDPLSPTTTVASSKGVLNLNGSGTFTFPSSVSGNAYYLAVSHRNAIDTWSAAPLTLTSNTSYDFTTAASKAYGSNQVQLAPGVFGFYSGDLPPKDDVTDIFDQAAIDNDIYNFSGGYIPSDLNGDGIVDILDQVYIDNNLFNFISSVHP